MLDTKKGHVSVGTAVLGPAVRTLWARDLAGAGPKPGASWAPAGGGGERRPTFFLQCLCTATPSRRVEGHRSRAAEHLRPLWALLRDEPAGQTSPRSPAPRPREMQNPSGRLRSRLRARMPGQSQSRPCARRPMEAPRQAVGGPRTTVTRRDPRLHEERHSLSGCGRNGMPHARLRRQRGSEVQRAGSRAGGAGGCGQARAEAGSVGDGAAKPSGAEGRAALRRPTRPPPAGPGRGSGQGPGAPPWSAGFARSSGGLGVPESPNVVPLHSVPSGSPSLASRAPRRTCAPEVLFELRCGT